MESRRNGPQLSSRHDDDESTASARELQPMSDPYSRAACLWLRLCVCPLFVRRADY